MWEGSGTREHLSRTLRKKGQGSRNRECTGDRCTGDRHVMLRDLDQVGPTVLVQGLCHLFSWDRSLSLSLFLCCA